MDSLYRSALGMTHNRENAEDLVQETFKEAWGSFHSYSPGSDCKAWLFRILFRVRRKPSQALQIHSVELEAAEHLLSVEPDVDRALEHKEVLSILNALPEHYRMAVVLADLENFSYSEIAQMLDVPLGTVMSRLNRARGLLRRRVLEATGRSETA